MGFKIFQTIVRPVLAEPKISTLLTKVAIKMPC